MTPAIPKRCLPVREEVRELLAEFETSVSGGKQVVVAAEGHFQASGGEEQPS